MCFQYPISYSEFSPLVMGAIPIMIECEIPLLREYKFYAVLSLTDDALQVSVLYRTVAQFGHDEAF